MGAQSNSFVNVSDYLGHIADASRKAGRPVWSNVELFEVHNISGRHPAPFSRIVKQMANEAPLVDKLIAWEWTSCLSVRAGRYLYKDTYPNATAELYEQYRAYVMKSVR